MFVRFSILAVKNFFSPHSAGSGEKIFFHRILLVAVKNFLSPLKRWKKIFHRLNVFFHRIHRIERKSYTFTQIHRKSYIF